MTQRLQAERSVSLAKSTSNQSTGRYSAIRRLIDPIAYLAPVLPESLNRHHLKGIIKGR